MEPFFAILLALLMLGAGLALGWLVGRGRAAALAEERAKACEQLRIELAAATGERDAARQDLAGLQADARNFEARMKELIQAKEALTARETNRRNPMPSTNANESRRVRTNPHKPPV